RIEGATRNNVRALDAQFPLGVFTSVTGVSGSGKSTLVSQLLVELVSERLGHAIDEDEEEHDWLEKRVVTEGGEIVAGLETIRRLVRVDQKPIGRKRRARGATMRGASHSMWRRGDARRAREKAS